MEDEPAIREVLTEYMKMQNYHFACAADGEEALALVSGQLSDLRRVKRTAPEADRGLIIHSDSYQEFWNGKPLELTLSEFLLLQVLMDKPKQVFTREQLILRIFNEDYVGNDRIIDAHVKNLRKKLPGNFIRTVIGVGYQFQEGGL